MTASPGPVIIGVNGSATDESALRLGVSEAQRLGTRVSLVHVVPDYVAISPLMPVAPSVFADIGVEVLRGAEKALREIDRDVEADTQLLHGSRARRLDEAAEEASLSSSVATSRRCWSGCSGGTRRPRWPRWPGALSSLSLPDGSRSPSAARCSSG